MSSSGILAAKISVFPNADTINGTVTAAKTFGNQGHPLFFYVP